MLLVDERRLELEDRVRAHLPDFQAEDEDAASSVTVLQLLNHTAGWDGDFFKSTGDGDDALARYIRSMGGSAAARPARRGRLLQQGLVRRRGTARGEGERHDVRSRIAHARTRAAQARGHPVLLP